MTKKSQFQRQWKTRCGTKCDPCVKTIPDTDPRTLHCSDWPVQVSSLIYTLSPNPPTWLPHQPCPLKLCSKLTSQNYESDKCEKFVQILKMRQENELRGILWGNWLDMSVLAQEANSSSSCWTFQGVTRLGKPC